MPVLFPETVAEACAMIAATPEYVPMAGGTDLLVHWPDALDRHDRTYLDLSSVRELTPIELDDPHLTIGAAATYWDLLRHRPAREGFPLLARAARQIGAIQIQARGTWGGNIANGSPAADGVAVLMAYDATVVLRSVRGEEEVPLSNLYRGYRELRRRPDQLITAVRIPRRVHDVEVFEKIGPRRAQAITKVGVTVTRSDFGWRVVATSMAPVVCRCPAIEAQLTQGGPVPTAQDWIPLIRRDLSPIDDLRSTAPYRERTFARVLFHALDGISNGD